MRRSEEIAGLRWSEIDPGAALVRLRGERTKNGRPHDIPLVPQALAILKARQRQEGGDFVFGTNGRRLCRFQRLAGRLRSVAQWCHRPTLDSRRILSKRF
jgi:integrase